MRTRTPGGFRKFSCKAVKKDLLTRLNEGPVVGDGGFAFALEKRGYVKAGAWTPEAVIENPDAVRQLHREFARAGADVMQTFTFYASEDKLSNRGNYAAKDYGVRELNQAACRIAQEVADEYGSLVCGGISQTPTYLEGLGKSKTQDEFLKQIEVFIEHDVDFLLAEYFENCEEAVWACESLQSSGKTIGASLCIGEMGDVQGVSTEDCARRLADAGAQVVGLNCHFGPYELNRGMEKVALALESYPGVHMIVQPSGYHTPDAKVKGHIELPEFPFSLEPRLITRFEIRKYARDAYEMGIRYIGGCCGFEAYHTREIAEELIEERAHKVTEGQRKYDRDAGSLKMSLKPWLRERGSKEYWLNLVPASGRPLSPSLAVLEAK